MSAQRFSGHLRIRVTLLQSDRYRCTIRDTESGDVETVYVGPPKHLERALDHPIAFDEAAHAAISFGDDVSQHAACKPDGSGWHVGRSRANAWPETAHE